MTLVNQISKDYSSELIFKTSRSSGPGGQNVNKVNTRVELRFDVNATALLNEPEKLMIFKGLAKHINKEGIIILVSQSERSQYQNKKKVIEKFNKMIQKALVPVKKRKSTYPTTAAIERRITEKRKLTEKKIRRRITE
jgi:ribosome-associated protein